MNSDESEDIKDIIKFIAANKIATVCCTDGDGSPYCFNCFYVFEERHQLLFFKSSVQTGHAKMIAENPLVAGTILPHKIQIMALKGIQFTGTVLYDNFPGKISPEIAYYKQLPLGLTKPGKVFCIQLDSIKMTDNSMGRKLLWNRYELV